jgi:hypothetical protein
MAIKGPQGWLGATDSGPRHGKWFPLGSAQSRAVNWWKSYRGKYRGLWTANRSNRKQLKCSLNHVFTIDLRTQESTTVTSRNGLPCNC